MASTSTKIGHGLAKVLGIKLDDGTPGSKLSRGESVFSVESADSYVEQEPTAAEWLRDVIPSGKDVLHYCHNLFPFTKWILRYNAQWLYGDLVAGITVGAVVVPQSMAYAQLAQLPVEYGLYSSFMGVLIYWFFATSKDITIGPVAVMSTIVGNIVISVAKKDPTIEGHVVASALAVIVGAIVCFLGLARLGWLVEFISLASISAFMTGSAINIAVGQVPALMGISSKIVNNRDSTYLVVINTLKHLGSSKLDAALGLTALTMLYLIRSSLNFAARKQPQHKKLYFFLATLRTAFVILLYTMIAWLMNLNLEDHDAKKSPVAILGTVPRGFKHAAVPTVNSNIISLFASELPASVIVLLIEHISISKSFGRVNNYTIDPSQELVAIGVTNLLGPFLGGYPATGSFSRTAIKSKAGVRTPFAGVITAVVVLLSIYALPAVFFYIPKAALSAVIIHAVGDLITPPNTVYQFWRVSPLEVPIFLAGVIITVFTTIEIGVYVTVSASAALLIFRLFKAQGRFLGKVKVRDMPSGQYIDGDAKRTGSGAGTGTGGHDTHPTRDVFIPFDNEDGSNPAIQPQHAYPGVFIFRFSEGFNYPNANHYLDYLSKVIFEQTQRTNPHSYARPGDRPWNDPGPRPGKEVNVDDHRPTLKAIVIDFSSVNNVDLTSIQNLIDVRNQLDRYTAPERVQWHFACINNRWTKRALANAGFGYPSVDSEDAFQRWKPIFSVAEIGGSSSAAAAGDEAYSKQFYHTQSKDLESRRPDDDSINASESSSDINTQLKDSATYKTKVAVVQGLNRPFFHIDVTSAVQSAVSGIEAQGKSVE